MNSFSCNIINSNVLGMKFYVYIIVAKKKIHNKYKNKQVYYFISESTRAGIYQNGFADGIPVEAASDGSIFLLKQVV